MCAIAIVCVQTQRKLTLQSYTPKKKLDLERKKRQFKQDQAQFGFFVSSGISS